MMQAYDFDLADFSDYKYSHVNFLGVNICVLGSLIYTKVKLPFSFLLRYCATSIINKYLRTLWPSLIPDPVIIMYWQRYDLSVMYMFM